MQYVNVRSAEGDGVTSSPPPELCAQCVQIVMSYMKRYFCLRGLAYASPPLDKNSVFYVRGALSAPGF